MEKLSLKLLRGPLVLQWAPVRELLLAHTWPPPAPLLILLVNSMVVMIFILKAPQAHA